MAIEIVQNILCDGHLHGAEERVTGRTIEPIIVDGSQKVLDLCDECETTFTYKLLVEFLRVYGRAPESKKPKKSKVQMDEELTHQCSFCERKLKSNQARLMHERRSHETEFYARADEEARIEHENQPPLVEIEEHGDIRVKHPADDVIFHGGRASCPSENCERGFKTRQGLSKHIDSFHPELIASTEEINA
jgi:hypothetical protein